jgi:hypothetical protein
MKSSFALCALLGVFAVGTGTATRGDVTVTQVNYHGWADARQMSNGVVELVYVPQIGRVMRYGYVGGPNVLWNNTSLDGKTTDLANPGKEWINYGGDKLWPSPQSNWTWPPDPLMDSAEQTVTVTPDKHLHIEGHTSFKYGIRFLREISLDPAGTTVTFKNTMLNANRVPMMPDPSDPTKQVPDPDPAKTEKLKVTWGIWEVTQVDNPTEARLPLYKAGHFAEGYYTFKDAGPAPATVDVTPTVVRLRRNTAKSCKIGGDARLGYLEADVQGITFRVSTTVEKGRNYPDDGCALEIYTNPDPLPYVELELLGPLHTLEAGKSAELTTHWSLSKK